jgi:TolB protein
MEAEDGTKDTGLWLVDVETGEYTVLLHQFPTPHITAGAISPDGQSVVYALNSGGIHEIWLSNIDGNDARMVYETATDVGLFSWSPDGHYLVMSGGRVLDMRDYELQTMVQNMVNGYGYSFSLVWSPDSSRIAYMAFDGPNPLTNKSLLQEGYSVDIFKGVSIHVLDVRTGKEQPLLKDGSMGHIDPAWSPTGTQIAFTSMMSGQTEIWRVNEDGTDLRQLTSNHAYVRFPYWSSILLPHETENQ